MRFRFIDPVRALAALAATLMTAAAVSAARASDELPVGYTRLTVAGNTAARGDSAGRLRVVVWYPAAAGTPTVPIEVGAPGKPLFREGMAAFDAPLSGGPARLPFVVVSHGTGGTNMDLSWLCAALAAHGYFVAAVDHPGNNALDPQTVQGLTLWWLRADDLSRTIDGVLADGRFGPRIDRDRIGAAGFSLGGATVLALAGARASAARLYAYCAHKSEAAVCNGAATPAIPDVMARTSELLRTSSAYRAASAAGARSHRDARVKAVFSIAPALGPEIIPESLRAIAIPVALVAGAGDPVVPPEDNAVPVALGLPDATLTILPREVAHYTFLTACTAAGIERFAAICEESGPARVEVHRQTANLAVTFFARTLGPR